MSQFVSVAKCAQVPEGRGLTVTIGGLSIGLFRVGNDYFAINAICPHVGGPLGQAIVEGETVHCPLHGWAFDLRTGACKTNPNRPVASYPVRVLEDEIQVQIP